MMSAITDLAIPTTFPLDDPKVQNLLKRYRHCLNQIRECNTRQGAQVWMDLAKELSDAIDWLTGLSNWPIW